MKNPLTRSFLPQSLFARLMLALLGVITVTLLVIIVLIMHERRELNLWRSGALDSASTIVETSTRLAGLDREARSIELEELRSQPRPQLRRLRPPPPQDLANIEKAFAKRLQKQLGAGYSVSISQPERRRGHVIRITGENQPDPRAEGTTAQGGAPGRVLGFEPPRMPSPEDLPAGPPGLSRQYMIARLVDVAVRLPDGDVVVFRAPALQIGPPLPRGIFLQLGVLTLVLALVLYFMTRSITRPLSDLARAADAMGRGENPPPLQERGAKELRDATRAFNAMRDRLHRYLDSRTRVLAAMSHDLRTPLTRLRLRTEAIEDAEMRERFVSDVEEMTQMVNGALSLFKGLTDTEPDVPVVIDDLLAAMQAEYAEQGESIIVEGRSSGPIRAKPMALKRCLSNLLHNAVTYGGGALVQITDGAELAVSIRDNGAGIPDEALERVFEPFYRVESSRNRDTGGTGLGLSIARDIAQAHGGAIVLRNLPEGGLEALLTLPRRTS